MKSKSFVDVEIRVDGVQKFDLDGEGLLRPTLVGCGPLLPHSMGYGLAMACYILAMTCYKWSGLATVT